MFAVLAASAFVAPAHMQVQYAKPFSLNFLLSFLLCLSLLQSALPVQRCSLAQDGPCARPQGLGILETRRSNMQSLLLDGPGCHAHARMHEASRITQSIVSQQEKLR